MTVAVAGCSSRREVGEPSGDVGGVVGVGDESVGPPVDLDEGRDVVVLVAVAGVGQHEVLDGVTS